MDGLTASFDSPVAVGIAALVLLVTTYFMYTKFSGPKALLPLDDFVKLPLIRREELSHDTRRFTFALPSAEHILGLPIGQHLSLKFIDSAGKEVLRSYTPVTSRPGEVSFVIKVYRPLPPKFPDGGLLSQHLDSLKVGDSILCRGPKGHVQWFESGKPFGTFSVKPLGKPKEERYCEQVGMIAGGTGITPMLQLLHSFFRTGKAGKISAHLIYANQTEDDILVRKELEQLSQEFPDQFTLHYTLDRPPANWTGSTGFITSDMVQKHLLFEDKSKPTQFFMCGPPPMIRYACLPALKEAGYTEKDWVTF